MKRLVMDMGFDKKELIDLDECVFNALNLFMSRKLPKLDLPKWKRPLVVGSGNAAVTGKIIFDDRDAVFADEGNYLHKLKTIRGIDGAVLISASGGKHAPIIAKKLKKKRLKTILLTNNSNALASKFVNKTIVFPKNSEPYTYNTSTYLGMIMSKTREDPRRILSYLGKLNKKIPRNLRAYDSFYFIVPSELHLARDMFLTKFDELFGSKISGRVFTVEQTKHAKTVVPSKKELFVYLGCKGEMFGKHKYHFHVDGIKGMDYGAMIAIGYFIIGKIQGQNKQWFKENIGNYVRWASGVFGEKISPIVE